MTMARCNRCGGSGRYSDQNPTTPGRFDWCEGCKSDGEVNVTNPNARCKRCSGTGKYSDQNPTVAGRYDWCAGCRGTGYSN